MDSGGEMNQSGPTNRWKDTRLPKLYKEAAKILKETTISKKGLKDLIYSNRNRMLHKKLLALIDKYLDNQNTINKFIEDSKLLELTKNEHVVKILCTELMFGRGQLPNIENNTINKINEKYYNYDHCIKDTSSSLNKHTIISDDCDTNTYNPKNTNQSVDIVDHNLIIKKRLRYVRINYLMITKQDLLERLITDGFVHLPPAESYDDYLDTIKNYVTRDSSECEEYFIEDFHLDDVIVFLQNTEFYNYEPYTNGSLFLQDKASCIPTHLLAPPPGSVVFDTCAAPGNKTLHMASFMENQGKIYAVDKDETRFKRLEEVIQLANGENVVQAVCSDIFQIRMKDYTDVEYVLVDPSCSGSGITERKKVDNHQEISQSRINNLAGFQKDLLSRVCTYFPNVKRIVYCTCSIKEEENEQVVEHIISKFGDKYQIEDLRENKTLSQWKHFGNEIYPNGKKCFYALTDDYCTGFFAAVFNRINFEKDTTFVKRKSKREYCDDENSTSLHENSFTKNKKKKFSLDE